MTILGLKDRLGNPLVLYLNLGRNFGRIGQSLSHLRQHVEVNNYFNMTNKSKRVEI